MHPTIGAGGWRSKLQSVTIEEVLIGTDRSTDVGKPRIKRRCKIQKTIARGKNSSIQEDTIAKQQLVRTAID